MNVILDDDARHDLKKMQRAQLLIFSKHIDKIAQNPDGRHLRHGMPFFVDEVGQGRIIYQVKGDTVYIIRCFQSHRDYENWYK